MAKPAQRVFALVAATMFLLTSVALGGLVLWEARQKDDLADTTNQATEATSEANNETQGDDMLKGTQLADFEPLKEQATELAIVDIKEGDGEVVKEGATITAHYTGAYGVNGEIFESSKDSGQPATFPLSGVIEGWQKGVPGMKVGGTRRLIIPGGMAYGEAQAGYTPGSTDRPQGTLIFDIELVSIGQ